MLTEQEKDIIKQTVPLLKEKGTEITSIFYPKMFKAHPELLNMFNQTNQKRGMQSSALAQAVMAAAVNIDNLSVIKPVIMPVAYKHCALQVYAEHYQLWGKFIKSHSRRDRIRRKRPCHSSLGESIWRHCGCVHPN